MNIAILENQAHQKFQSAPLLTSDPKPASSHMHYVRKYAKCSSLLVVLTQLAIKYEAACLC